MALGEFKENILDVTGRDANGDAGNVRRNAIQANEVLLGLESGALESIQDRGASLAKSVSESRQQQEERSRKSMNDFIFTEMINRINDLNTQLDDIRANIKTLDAELRAEYGEDYMEVMAQTYLDDDELESLEGLSSAQRKKRIEGMLRDKMLDENGSATDQYKGLKIAELMEQIEEEEKIQARVEKLEAAQATGDPEIVKKALGDDELTNDAALNATKNETGLSLTEAYGDAANAKTEQAAAAIESHDVEENANVDQAFADFDNFKMV